MVKKFCERHLRRIDPFVAVILVTAAVYVGNQWTPSSYGTVLTIFGAEGAGLVLGTPRDVLSDESRIWTPYIQIAVNNGFKRFNETSVYREDLRNFQGLPLADWAVVFKPYFWPFFFVSPSRAFSFYHAFFIVQFFLGYYFLLRAFAFSRLSSALASFGLFFTGFVQFWWASWGGPLLSGFPWVLLIFVARIPLLLKTVVLTYVVPVWLLAHLYPPMVIALAFAGAVIVVAFSANSLNWRNIVATAIGISGGLVLVGIYLFDAIHAMMATVYPGQRVVHGGDLPGPQWLAQFFPFLVTSGLKSLVNISVLEASTVGSYLVLISLVFVNYRHSVRSTRSLDPDTSERGRRVVLVLSCGFALISFWQLLPIPAGIGQFLLWHLVPPRSMLFASGLLLYLLALSLLHMTELRLTWPRFFIAVAVIVLVSIMSKGWVWKGEIAASLTDPFIVLPLGTVVALRRYLVSFRIQSAALVGCVALANAVGFSNINPVQAAQPIFNRPPSLVVGCLEKLQLRHPRKWLVVADQFEGAILNGWGFRSIGHTLLAPRLSFFRPFFSEISEEEFRQIFNRYGRIFPSLTERPFIATADVIYVPATVFQPVRPRMTLETALSEKYPARGHIDVVITDPRTTDRITVIGWADFDFASPESQLRIITKLPVVDIEASPNIRLDVTRAMGDTSCVLRGFEISLKLKKSVSTDIVRRSICIVSDDPHYGKFLLHNSLAPGACATRIL